ncbi:unnamed protein product, partial [Phaeothamnion confervicola]
MADPRPVVAYATTVTKVSERFVLDAVEVLGLSVDRICKESRYACAKVVIVHEDIGERAAAELADAGWRVLLRPVPVNVTLIAGDFYREALPGSGCCGELELLKLYAYTLTEYRRVVHVDIDVLLLRPLDGLLDLEASLVYTTDPNMGSKGDAAPPVQGGFLVVKPDLDVFDQLLAVVYEAGGLGIRLSGDWRPGTGWGGLGIGWCWGGPTIQGLLPYFYHAV